MTLSRGKPLGRGKPLARGKALARGKGLASGGSRLKAGKRLKQVSDRRRAENEERRDVLMAVAVRANHHCEACPRLAAAGHLLPWSQEIHQGQDGHEILTRARGGSILDAANILYACRRAHDWTHAHSTLAEELGLLLPSAS